MELFWLGQSCFRIRGRDATVLTDPFDKASGYALGRVAADVVTVSNAHPNHSTTEGVDGTPRVIDGPGEYEVHGVYITGMRTSPPHAPDGMTRNTAYRITVDDMTICHLGDLAALLNTEQIEMMKDIDVLLVPVGGHCTIGASQAVEVISQVEPKLVVPMHYGTEQSTAELDPLDRFLHEMGIAQAEPQAKLNITRSSLPGEPTVAVLSYRR
ncbi:MAG: hypothetical protein QOF51_4199 [Chloroflexota bacterium]|jgi:L-ascorbate metabolism protein UlaG (beta-lactamase superfamily)|nr:hypothetical protein [Chloroflexota bacterium]